MDNHYDQSLTELSEQLRKDLGLPVENLTNSFWQEPPTQLPQKSSTLPEDTDVLIIGTGITGCSVARHLLQNHDSIRVLMVDARLITSGATGRNGGHIKAVPELSYAELMPVIGREKAQEVVLFTMKNVKDLLKVAASLSPDLQHRGEVRHVEALNIFTDEDQMSRISSTIKAFDDNPEFRGRSRLIDKKTLTEYDVCNAVGGVASQAGAAWPYRLITGLLSDMIDNYSPRFQIEANTPVLSIDAL